MEPAVQAVMTDAAAHREQFAAFSRSLSAHQLQAPIAGATWVVKDYVAHLATIDIWVDEWFEHQADGRPWRPQGEGGATFSIDTWNEARIDERRAATVDELLAEAAGHRARLTQTVARFTPPVLESTFEFHGQTITFLRYLQLWTAHDPAHAADMVRAIPRFSPAAAASEWLAKAGFPPA